MRTTYLLTGILALAILSGCQDTLVNPDSTNPEIAGSTIESILTPQAASKAGAQLGGMIWADGELFGTVGTPSAFKPDHGPFDRLFTGAVFKDGVGAISESKPGDQDFNGGRWEVYSLREGVMTDYSNADSVEDLNMADFEAAGVYFECPLLPRHDG